MGVRAPGGCSAESTPVGTGPTFTDGEQQHRDTEIRVVVQGQFFRLFYFSASREINS